MSQSSEPICHRHHWGWQIRFRVTIGPTCVNDQSTASSDGLVYSFNEANGVLNAVPKPDAARVGGLGMLILPRRCRS